MKLSLVTSKTTQNITTDVVFEYDENGQAKTGFKIVGPDSQQYRAEQERQRIANRKRGSVKKVDLKTDEGQALIDRVTQENLTATAVAVVVDWFGFEDDAGQPVAFNAEHVAAIYEAKPSWRDKVVVALDQEDAFLPKPVTA